MKYRENNWKLDTNLYNSVVKCSAYKYTDETTSIVHNLEPEWPINPEVVEN